MFFFSFFLSVVGCVVKGIVSSLRPLGNPLVFQTAREFAATAILRMRHLINPNLIAVPNDASPRLFAAVLVLQLHHKVRKGLGGKEKNCSAFCINVASKRSCFVELVVCSSGSSGWRLRCGARNCSCAI